MSDRLDYKRHHDDVGYDRVSLSLPAGLAFDIIVVPRYKTSGLSGDEWRVSGTLLYHGESSGEAQLLSSMTRLEWMVQGAYYHVEQEGLIGPLGGRGPVVVTFENKGHLLYRFNDLPDLQTALGCLPYLRLVFPERRVGADHATYAAWEDQCFQPGCAEAAISTYRIVKEYNKQGDPVEPKEWRHDQHRRFCRRHLRRGDCGLEDADDNYVVIDGPGPNDATARPSDESPSVFGGVVTLNQGVGDE